MVWKPMLEQSRVVQAEDDVALYDEVTEEQYKRIVLGRLQKDDFVIDDGVSGYMDNGMDDWGQQDADEEDDEKDHHSRRKCKSTPYHTFL